MSYWQNYPKFFVSLQKAWWGTAATKENSWAYEYLPKLDKLYDLLAVFDLMHQGKMNGYICQGFNPLAAAPNKAKNIEALSKLKFLVVIDPLITETSTFWRNVGEFNPVETRRRLRRRCSGCRPAASPRRTARSRTPGRWLQWHYKGAEPPGEALTDLEIMAELFFRIRSLYAKEGGDVPGARS